MTKLPAAHEQSIAPTGSTFPDAPIEGKPSLTLYKEWVLNLLATDYLCQHFIFLHPLDITFMRSDVVVFNNIVMVEHLFWGLMEDNPMHLATLAKTYFIAQDT